MPPSLVAETTQPSGTDDTLPIRHKGLARQWRLPLTKKRELERAILMNKSTTKTLVPPVRLLHVPNWLRLRCLKRFGTNGGRTDGWSVLENAIAKVEAGAAGCYISNWLDHWGSTKIDGEVCFVSEPYSNWPPEREDFEIPHRLALAVNARLLAIPESAWYPRSTIRLLFKPNPEK